jgi:hypothetical protein
VISILLFLILIVLLLGAETVKDSMVYGLIAAVAAMCGVFGLVYIRDWQEKRAAARLAAPLVDRARLLGEEVARTALFGLLIVVALYAVLYISR